MGHCQAKSQPPETWSFGYKVALSLLLLIILPSLLSMPILKIISAIPNLSQSIPPNLIKFLECFDIEANLGGLFKLPIRKENSNSFDLRFIDGLKTLLTFTTVLLHTSKKFLIKFCIDFCNNILNSNFYSIYNISVYILPDVSLHWPYNIQRCECIPVIHSSHVESNCLFDECLFHY